MASEDYSKMKFQSKHSHSGLDILEIMALFHIGVAL